LFFINFIYSYLIMFCVGMSCVRVLIFLPSLLCIRSDQLALLNASCMEYKKQSKPLTISDQHFTNYLCIYFRYPQQLQIGFEVPKASRKLQKKRRRRLSKFSELVLKLRRCYVPGPNFYPTIRLAYLDYI